MKTLALVLALSFNAAACVTSSDLRAVADSVERLETVVDDETATPADVEAAVKAAKEEIHAVAKGVEDRSETFIDTLTSADGGGVSALVTALGLGALNYYRNRQRVARGEPVKAPPKA